MTKATKPRDAWPERTYRSARARGLSLIELVITIFIIALMVGILLPSLNMVRGQAQTGRCLSNLRQLSGAITAYTSDNRGVLPFGYWSGTSDPAVPADGFETDWSILIDSYFTGGMATFTDTSSNPREGLPEEYQCPQAQYANQGDKHYLCHPILMPALNSTNGPYPPYRFTRVQRPGEVALLMDGAQTGTAQDPRSSLAVGEIIGGELLLSGNDPWYNAADTDSNDSIKPGPNSDNGSVANAAGNIRWRHSSNQAANVTFLDGHAISAKIPDLQADNVTPVAGTGDLKIRNLQADP